MTGRKLGSDAHSFRLLQFLFKGNVSARQISASYHSGFTFAFMGAGEGVELLISVTLVYINPFVIHLHRYRSDVAVRNQL